jgi:hypothetical protein
MKPKLILCLALVLSSGLFGCSTTNSRLQNANGHDANANDDFQLETQIDLVEKAALDSALPDTNWTNKAPCFVLNDALDELERHHWLWATNPSIPPRLSRAVLTVFPSLTNASIDPRPGDQWWCNAMQMLGKTHDRAMINVLRPYLKEKDLAGDGGNLGAGISTLRICDEAAMAISSLLGEEWSFPDTDDDIGELFDSSDNASIPKFTYYDKKQNKWDTWQGYNPAWKEWDKKITKLEKHLDAMGFTNAPVNHSVAVSRVLPVITNVPSQTNSPTDLPWHGVIDPATGLPTEPVKQP